MSKVSWFILIREMFLLMLSIKLRHIFLGKSNQLFTTNKKNWTFLLDTVVRLFVFIVCLKL